MKYYKEQSKTAMVLKKTEDNSDEKYLLLALIRLEDMAIDLLVIRSRFINYMPWAYHSDIMNNLSRIQIN